MAKTSSSSQKETGKYSAEPASKQAAIDKANRSEHSSAGSGGSDKSGKQVGQYGAPAAKGGGSTIDAVLGSLIPNLNAPTGQSMGALGPALSQVPGVGGLMGLSEIVRSIYDANGWSYETDTPGWAADGTFTNTPDSAETRQQASLQSVLDQISGGGGGDGGTNPPAGTDPTAKTPEQLIDDLVNALRAGALTSAGAEATRRGLNPGDYTDIFNQQIDQGLSTLPTDRLSWTEAGIRGALPSTLGATALDNEQSRLRNVYGNQIAGYAPLGFDASLIPDTFDDAVIDQIYNSQYGTANQFLQRARDRGNLNDTGYNAAIQGLNTQGQQARSTLSALGDSLLNSYRQNIRGIADEGRTGASSYTLGQTFDPTSYQDRITSRVGEYGGRVAGDLQNAVGDQTLFDPSTLYTQGGQAQGVTAGNRNALAGVLERNYNRDAPRGLGNRGAF